MRAADKVDIFAKERYIPLEDLNWEWLTRDISIVIELWQQGEAIDRIAKLVRRSVDEVAILVMDMRRRGLIEIRKGGVWGG